MFSRRSLIAIAFAGSALTAAEASAQGQAIVGIETQTSYFVDGRITAVDSTARTVTITEPNGAPRTLNVSPAAANLAATKIGDNVSLSIEEVRTFVLSGPGTKTPQPRSASVAAAVEAGRGIAGAGVSRSIANWWVVGVNPAANTITLVNPNSGPVQTYNVTTQAGREQLPRVKVGDSLTEISSRVTVASITPKV